MILVGLLKLCTLAAAGMPNEGRLRSTCSIYLLRVQGELLGSISVQDGQVVRIEQDSQSGDGKAIVQWEDRRPLRTVRGGLPKSERMVPGQWA